MSEMAGIKSNREPELPLQDFRAIAIQSGVIEDIFAKRGILFEGYDAVGRPESKVDTAIRLARLSMEANVSRPPLSPDNIETLRQAGLPI